MTEAAINADWNRDLLVALGDDVGKDSWSLRLQYRPMIRFIWLERRDHGARRHHDAL